MTSPIGQKPRPITPPPAAKPPPPATAAPAKPATAAPAKPATAAPAKPATAAPAKPADTMGKPATTQAAGGNQAANKPGSIIDRLKNSKINQALDSKIGKLGAHSLGGAGAGVGLASGISDIVKGAKAGDANTIAGGTLSAASATLGGAAVGIESGVFGKIGQGFKNLFGGAGKAGGTAAKGAEAAAKAGGTAAKVGAEVAGKGAARFVPGLNIGIAALDTANAARTLADKNASVGAKVTSTITAAGSIAAATNIPIVSQIGAGISAVSGIVGGVLGFLGK